MNVFVLSPGRSGTLTFSRVCSHITNFTSAHESRRGKIGALRFDYPERHIEVDGHLVWYLGALDEAYGKNAFYIHLIRREDLVVKSLLNRWGATGIKEYVSGQLGVDFAKIPKTNRDEVCRDYYRMAHANIRFFLKDKVKKMRVHLDCLAEHCGKFWKRIGAVGDLKSAQVEARKRHNAS